MLLITRYIAFVVLSCVYLAASLAGLIGTMSFPVVSSGPQSVASATAGTKEKPKVFWTQRRHIPLVKTVSTPNETACAFKFTSVIQRHFIIPQYSHNDSYLLLFASPVSDRAPPVA